MASSNRVPEALRTAVDVVLDTQRKSSKPLAVILAGHNGSGKSTMWYEHLADQFQIPLVNADRMMLSILPEVLHDKPLPAWAATLRDTNENWMEVAQRGVQAFVAESMGRKVPFAMETVFSHWKKLPNGNFESKIDTIKDLQKANYFVLLIFVGLSNVALSIGRVDTRRRSGGHDVPIAKLEERFARTQKAIQGAAGVADAAILADNSRDTDKAFTLCHVRVGGVEIYDRRANQSKVPREILEWLDIVCPQSQK